MIRKKFKKELKTIVEKYLLGQYEESVSVFDELVVKFGTEQLNSTQQYKLKKFMHIFFGTTVGFTDFTFDISRV